MQPSYRKPDIGSGTWDPDLIPDLAGLATVWGEWIRKLRIIDVTLYLPRPSFQGFTTKTTFFLRNDKDEMSTL